MNCQNRKHLVGNIIGSSLIEVMIAFGLMGIVSLAIASMLNGQQKSINSLVQKQEMLDLKNTLLRQFTKPGVCSWQLSGKTIDVTVAPTQALPSPTVITLTELRHGLNVTSPLIAKVGQPLIATSTNLMVNTITLKNIYATGNPFEYSGILEISFTASSLTFAWKPVQIPLIVRVVETDVAPSLRIASCDPMEGSPSLIVVTSPIVEFVYNYPVSGGWHSQKVTATCPANSVFLSCLGCLGVGCVPNNLAYSSSAYGDGVGEQTAMIDFSYILESDVSCSIVVSASYIEPIQTSSPIYTNIHNQTIRGSARCLKL